MGWVASVTKPSHPRPSRHSQEMSNFWSYVWLGSWYPTFYLPYMVNLISIRYASHAQHLLTNPRVNTHVSTRPSCRGRCTPDPSGKILFTSVSWGVWSYSNSNTGQCRVLSRRRRDDEQFHTRSANTSIEVIPPLVFSGEALLEIPRLSRLKGVQVYSEAEPGAWYLHRCLESDDWSA